MIAVWLAGCRGEPSLDGLRSEDATAVDDIDFGEEVDSPAVLPRFKSIAAGNFHTCALDTDGRAWCWGTNWHGQLGIEDDFETEAVHATARLVETDVAFEEIDAGQEHTCARTREGKVYCWGINWTDAFNDHTGGGQLGNGTFVESWRPFEVVGISDATGVEIAGNHSCALRQGGKVSCWGDNRSGQVDGSLEDKVPLPVEIASLAKVRSLALGDDFTCVAFETGEVSCWGSNYKGALGTDDATDHGTPTPVLELSDVTELSANASSVCALTSERELFCWGANLFRVVDSMVTSPLLVRPTRIELDEPIDHIFLGGGWLASPQVCTLRSGLLRCWGDNSNGQIGNGRTIANGEAEEPVDIIDENVEVALGFRHSCVVRLDGSALCWGANEYGQLGDNAVYSRPNPQLVFGVSGAVDVAIGHDRTCALLGDGMVKCWGAAIDQETVDDLSGVTSISAKFNGAVCVIARQQVRCWPGPYDSQFTGLRLVDGLNDASAIAVAADHTCARTNTGRVKCWGRNGSGQLGDGTVEDREAPTLVPDLEGVAQVVADGGSTCALLFDGTVMCWGGTVLPTEGPDSASTPVTQPTRLPDVADATMITSGFGWYCARLADGTGVCWGGSSDSPPFFHVDPPTKLLGVNRLRGIFRGGAHTCATTDDGGLSCWGWNEFGQLGSEIVVFEAPSPDWASFPQPVPNIDGVRSVALGEAHTCVALEDGSVWCWGRSSRNELGDGNRVDKWVPTLVRFE